MGVPVTGLAFPSPATTEPADQFLAVQLFLERAKQAHPPLSLDDNLESTVDVCRRIEGLPLAIELAATWLRIMPCDQIAAQIDSSLDFLTTPFRNVPERHRGLRAVSDRSWRRLASTTMSCAALSVRGPGAGQAPGMTLQGVLRSGARPAPGSQPAHR